MSVDWHIVENDAVNLRQHNHGLFMDCLILITHTHTHTQK